MKSGEERRTPFADASAFWQMRELSPSLSVCGSVEAGSKLEGRELQASLKRGGDGYAALFSGKGWLCAEGSPMDAPSEDMSFSVRVRAEARPSGVFHSSWLSLVIDGGGLAIAMLGVGSGERAMFRETPLAPLKPGAWHDLILRFKGPLMEFVADGSLLASLSLEEPLRPVLPSPFMLGGWRIDNPPFQSFPEKIVKDLFERPLYGAIGHFAFWRRALSDEEAAFLCGVKSLKRPARKPAWRKCLEAFNAFHDASLAKDLGRCAELGLSVRKFMARDPRRPMYHLSAPLGWILDPVACVHHDGLYHVYSYRNIFALLVCNSLDHYVSEDLVRWRDMPVGVWADSKLDFYGIWLGNIFLDDAGALTMLYTGHGFEGKFGVIARSRDKLVSFEGKQAAISSLPHHDGHVWKDGDTWFSITTRQHWGRREGDLGDEFVILSSPDLLNWTERGELFHASKVAEADADEDRQASGFAEFPYMLPFGDKHVFLAGTHPVKYWIGRFDKELLRFIPDSPEGALLDYLNPFHCFNPMTVDAKGPGGAERRVVQSMYLYAAGNVDGLPWNGFHLLPRTLDLKEGRLVQEPVPEVETLRGGRRSLGQVRLKPGGSGLLKGFGGDCLEIAAEFDPGSAKRVGLKVRVSSDGGSSTSIYYDVASGRFGAEGNLLNPVPFRELGSGPAYLKPGEPVRFRVFLDKCVLEAFLNGCACGASFKRELPLDALGLDVICEGGEAVLRSLDVWEMKPAWPL